MLADGARAVLGPDAVAKIEDFAYGVDDRVKRVLHREDKPQAYWDVPTATTSAASAPAPPADGGAPAPAPYRPTDVGPMFPQWAAPGDGTWLPVADARRPDEAPRMWKTLLHPDRIRAWAAVSIAALDLSRVDVQLVAGRYEPEAEEKEAKGYVRPAVVPPERHGALLAAWNGGFKATHGHHGMRIDGVTLIRPHKDGCTVALYTDGHLAIRTWSAIADGEPTMTWWRGTPGCMVEQGKLHPGLVDDNTYWGATLEGSTVIRRSAIGLSEDGKVLYVGVGDATAAPAIARAMKHAGAFDVAQLDVNWSYPKFLVYEPKEPGSDTLVAKALCKGFEFADDEYIGERAQRDFFYATRKGD